MAKWVLYCSDNSGKKQAIKVTATNKPDAIKKAFEKARKNAKGDLTPYWECKLISAD